MLSFLMLLATPLLAATTVHTDFEGGSLGRIEKVSDARFRLGAKGEKDQDGRNRQANWYYFRVDGAPKRELILDIVDLPGEYNYKPNRGAITKDTPPVISYDQRTWKHIDTFEYDAGEPHCACESHRRLRVSGSRTFLHTPARTSPACARKRPDTPISTSRSSARPPVAGTCCSGRSRPAIPAPPRRRPG